MKLKVSEHNFIHKSIALWNSLIGDIIVSNNPNLTRGYIVPGEKPNSDLSASIAFVKSKIKSVLLSSQSKGSAEIWDETNLAIFCYTKWKPGKFCYTHILWHPILHYFDCLIIKFVIILVIFHHWPFQIWFNKVVWFLFVLFLTIK